jgi:hypothetical protein
MPGILKGNCALVPVRCLFKELASSGSVARRAGSSPSEAFLAARYPARPGLRQADAQSSL